MFRNYLSAALGNLARNWLYAGITILGLAVSFAAAILIGLYLREEFSFDRFLPGYQQVYRVETEINLPGAKPMRTNQTVTTVAGRMLLDFPEFERIARFEVFPGVIKDGEVTTDETIVWADPGLFKVLPFPVLAGDADAALAAPDGLVLTRSMARKYFGEDAPLGRTLLVNATPSIPGLSSFHPMRVMAVLQDIPSNSHLNGQIVGSGRAAFSILTLDDRDASPFNLVSLTYGRLKPGASAEALRGRLKAFADRRYASTPGKPSNVQFHLMPLAGLHFTARTGGPPGDVMRPPGDKTIDAGVAAVGALIVIIAAINFVTLMTARATRRAVEVGVRKAVGASRRDLIIQFMGEALIYVLSATVLAVALAELTLPYLNAFLRRGLRFDYLGDPAMAAAILGGVLLTAFLAGLYPALMLSSFRPAATLKGGGVQPAGSAGVRQVLVVVQFAILIGLIVMTATIYRQTDFALHDALRLDNSEVIAMRTECRSAFTQEVSRLAGVKAVSCSDQTALANGGSNSLVTMPDRSTRTVQQANLDVGFFELHGLKPRAGRFFSRAQGEDMVLDRPGPVHDRQPTIVLNETAARQLGFANPADAVGKTFAWTRWSSSAGPGALPPALPSRVIGIVPDFSLGSARDPIQPTLYFVQPAWARTVLVKLDGRRLPETLRAIERTWKRTGNDRPASYVFEDQAMQTLYRDVITQGVVLAVCAGLAICIACLGLFALAAFTTERRTQEIGIRKAMGAETADIVGLLLWQFTQPVLWANLVAWPVAWWVMDRWLQGFAYHVDLPLWLFAAATAAGVAIAWATVSTHAWLVARAKPVSALRYE